MKRLGGALAFALALCGCATAPADLASPSAWQIGPIINGQQLSVGMPTTPAAEAGGWGFDIPQATFPPDKHVHYVTAAYGSLAGKTALHLHYHVDAPAGARVLARTAENGPSLLTLYFQRCGDDWSGGVASNPAFETYRWYATFATITPIAAGDYDVVAPFSSRWTAIMTSASDTSPAAFADALAHACRVGFVLGGGDGYGHGVYAEGAPVHLTVLSFTVE